MAFAPLLLFVRHSCCVAGKVKFVVDVDRKMEVVEVLGVKG